MCTGWMNASIDTVIFLVMSVLINWSMPASPFTQPLISMSCLSELTRLPTSITGMDPLSYSYSHFGVCAPLFVKGLLFTLLSTMTNMACEANCMGIFFYLYNRVCFCWAGMMISFKSTPYVMSRRFSACCVTQEFSSYITGYRMSYLSLHCLFNCFYTLECLSHSSRQSR